MGLMEAWLSAVERLGLMETWLLAVATGVEPAVVVGTFASLQYLPVSTLFMRAGMPGRMRPVVLLACCSVNCSAGVLPVPDGFVTAGLVAEPTET